MTPVDTNYLRTRRAGPASDLEKVKSMSHKIFLTEFALAIRHPASLRCTLMHAQAHTHAPSSIRINQIVFAQCHDLFVLIIIFVVVGVGVAGETKTETQKQQKIQFRLVAHFFTYSFVRAA